MNTKATTSGHLMKYLKTIALSSVLVGALGATARAECICSPDCTKCDACPEQYETLSSCRACYRSTKTNLGTSVMCSFVGTRVSSPIWKYLLPDSLPGTRQDTIKEPRLWPLGPPFDLSQHDFVLTMSQPHIPSMTTPPSITTVESNEASFIGQAKPWWSHIVGGVLPGTRPDFEQPNLVAILPGTRPTIRPRFGDELRAPSAASESILIGDDRADTPTILPGTRPDETVAPTNAETKASTMDLR